jgi:hypothetical protein
VLKAYFDGSIVNRKWMTLACVAADNEEWLALDKAWQDTRKARGNPSGLHMTDAMALKGEFKNWTEEKRNYLIDGFVQGLTGFRNRSHLQSFTCTVDLESHARWKRIKKHPAPARLCARIVFAHILRWYDDFSEQVLERMELTFDRSEPYKHHIEADWKNKEICKRFPLYQWIKEIGSASAVDVPGLQIADMIAWGTNRLAAGSHWNSDPFYAMAVQSSSALPRLARTLDERTFSKSTFPEEGFERINPQRVKQMKDAELNRYLITL